MRSRRVGRRRQAQVPAVRIAPAREARPRAYAVRRPALDRHGTARRSCGAERTRSPVDIRAAVVEATVDLAVLLGLILNELLTNAFTYGTPGPRGARLVIACPIPE